MKNNRKKRVEEIYPLTPLQQGLMFHSMFAPGSGFYIVQFRLVLQELNKEAFKRAWQQVIDRHEILRTAFVSEGVKEPLQVVLSKVALAWREEDWRVFSPAEMEQKLQAYLEWDRTTDYDFRQAPLMRVALMQIAEDEYHFVWSHHHLLLDGWSVPLLIKEMAAFYEANCKGEALEVAKPRAYRDYIAWLEQQDEGAAERFWRQELQGITAPTKLSIDHGEELKAGAWEFAEQRVNLSEELTSELQRLARQEKITLNTIVQGAWALLLGRYSGESRVMFGTTVSGRPAELAGVERMVGLFINTVPLQVEIKQNETVATWLKQIQQKHTEIRQYEYTPLVKIQQWSEMSRGLPLFDTMLAFANYPVNPSLVRQDGDRGLKATSVESVEKPHYPLAIAVTPGQSLSINIRHDCSRYEVAVVQRVLVQLESLLAAIVTQAQEPLVQLELLSEAEREQMARWNETSAEYPRETCIHELFEQQVAQTPAAPAVIFKGEELSYEELNARANQLAHYLRERGVRAGEPVGLCVERSLEMVVGMLGVLKAGGGYVPIDPEYPRERQAQMLVDSDIKLLLTQEKLVEQLPEHGAQVVQLDGDWEEIAKCAERNLSGGVSAENLAYMIYTSGSTGQPKGVMVPHRALGNHMAWMQQRFPLTVADRVIQKTPFSFDASVWELFAPLLVGARLVMAVPGGHRDVTYLVRFIKEQQITALKIVPSLLEPLLEESGIEECVSLRYVFCGAEAMPVKLAEKFYQRLDVELFNLYGPTEAAIDVTYWECEGATKRRSIPIGRPIINTQAYVLDEALRVVPVGVRGELYVGGESLAHGYWRRAGLTAERFVPHPYSTSAGARLYRTGDVVRWNEAGELEYLGRNDHQVKIRGFRIETGEIETALLERAEVGRAVVLVREEEGRGKQLAAFVVSSNGEEPSSKELREYLQGRMPEYMVPGSIVVVGELPLMPNGKVDRQALLALSKETAASEYEGPRNEIEELLVQVWQEVLGLERVGIHDNFFELGGDSIVSIQVIARMRQQGVKFKLKEMFQHQTIAELAQVANATESGEQEKDEAVGAVALTPIQQRFFAQGLANPHHYNQAVLLATDDCSEVSVLETVMQKLVTHHAALRLRFTKTEDGWQQAYAETAADEALVTVMDLSDLGEEEQRAALEAEAAAVQASLNISVGPVLRVVLFNCGERGARLLLVVHHLVVDGVSWRILLEDLQTLYGQARRGEELELPAGTSTFKRWSESLGQYASSAEMQQEASYWQEHKFSGRLPVDDEAGENTVGSARSVEVKLSREETLGLLQEVPKAYHTQIQEVLMTALAHAMRDWTGADQLLVEMEGHGREDVVAGVDVSRTVGWFTSIYPVQLELNTEELASALKSIKEQLRGVPERGIGYGVWRYLGAGVGERESAAEVSFNYLGQFDQVLSGGEFRAATESAGPAQSLESRRTHLLAIGGMVIDGQLQMNWAYSEAVHRRETIERVAAQFAEKLRELIAHCQSEGAGGHTPSDFPLARIEQTQLELIETKHPELEDVYPLTPLQQGLMFHSFFAPGSGFYLIQLKLIFQELNKKAFQRAWQQVIDRHEILRTAFVSEGVKEPLQVVLSKVALAWREEDWRVFSPAEMEQKLQAYLEWDRTTDYDFRQAPLMRVALMQIADDEYHFVWSHHHLLLDGWSVPLLIKEMAAFYEANCKGEALEVAKPRAYRDYIAWLEQQDEGAAERFWRQELQGITAPTKLSIDRGAGTTTSSDEFRTQRMSLSEELTAQLRELGRQEKITLNTIVQGAWALLLGRYSGESRVMFGTTVSGRPAELAGVERMVGMFINTVPLQVEIKPSETVASWLKQIQQKHTEIRQYEYTPLVKIQQWSEMSRGLPLFDTMLAFGNYPVNPSLVRQDGDRGLKATSVESVEKPHYPLAIAVTPGQSLSINIRHDCSRYEVAVVQRVLVQLESLLAAIVTQAQEPLVQLELLSETEREQMARWNETSAEYPRETCIHELFEQQVAQTPAAPAVLFKGEELSYEELNARANQLAHYLRERGVRAGEPVGLCVERSLEMVVGMLGVLKAGGGYVPIDPEYPRERQAQMLVDSDIKLLLTQQKLVEQLPEHGAQVVQLDGDWEEIARCGERNLSGGVSAENLAYMIYTSGSTGQPKGVMVPHRALGNHMAWMQRRFPLTVADRVIQKTPFSFDASVWEFYAPLLAGAQLIMAEPGGHADPGYLVQLIVAQQVTTLQLVPTLLERLLEEAGVEQCVSLRRVFCGGEALSVSLTERFREQLGAEFYNLYGPTEVTIDATYWEYAEQAGRSSIPIGKPVSNTQVYVLDEGQRVVPVGVAGELYLGGESLAHGYWQRAGLTAERFVPHPYTTTAGARLYRTGDVVRWNEAGELEYLGRNDHQVKIRGFRIETGEIETALQERAEVGRAVVLVREEEGRGKQLAAFVVARNGVEPSSKELREYLQERMPEYMVPGSIAVVGELPLMPNGKVDRQALLALSKETPGSEYEGARNEIEKLLVQVWQEVLGVERVGIHDNFFELGGDSIVSIQVIARMRQQGVKFKLKEMFQHQTIAELVQVANATELEEQEKDEAVGAMALTPIQQHFFARGLANPHHYNQAVLLATDDCLEESVLERVMQKLVTHHAALRLRFTETAAGWEQAYAETVEQSIVTVMDLSDLGEAEQRAALEAEAAAVQASLNISAGPVLRVVLFNYGPERGARLLLVVHHLVVDGVSWRILLEDLQTAYEQARRGENIELPGRTNSFKRWSESLRQYASSAELELQANYWLDERRREVQRLPVDYEGGENTAASANSIVVELSPEETHTLLQEVPKAYHTQIQEVLVTAVALALREWTGADELLLEMEGHGREEVVAGVDVSRTVGWFTSVYPVLLELEGDEIATALKSIKEQLRGVPQRGIGYGIWKYLRAEETERADLEEMVAAEVSFNYLGQFDQVLSGGEFRAATESAGPAQDQREKREHLIAINGMVIDEQLRMTWGYSETVHRVETIERVAAQFAETLRALITHCQSEGVGGHTPSDFPLVRLEQKQLELIETRYPKLEDVYPQTPLQQGLIFHSMFAPGSGFYVVQFRLVLQELNKDAFQRAWQQVMDRHEILRTAFVSEGVRDPVQVVLSKVPLIWYEEDWREFSPAEVEQKLQEYMEWDRTADYDFGQAPAMRVALLQSAEHEYHFVWSHHHLLLDGWSVPLLIKEMAAFYEANCKGEALELAKPRPYRDYIAWLAQQNEEAAQIFWRQELQGITAPTKLSIDRGMELGVEAGALDFADQRVNLSEELTSELQQLARQEKITLNTIVQGAWALLLSRYSSESRVMFGTTVSGRPAELAGVERMVGMFINTVPFQVEIGQSETVVNWLKQIQQKHTEIRQYEHTPLMKIQSWSDIPRGFPLFETVLGFENYPLNNVVKETVSRLRIPRAYGYDRNHYPLSIAVVPGPELSLKITFNSERFPTHSVGRMFESLEALLQKIVVSSESTLMELLETVERAGIERKLSREQEREKFNFSKLINVRRKAITGVREESVL